MLPFKLVIVVALLLIVLCLSPLNDFAVQCGTLLLFAFVIYLDQKSGLNSDMRGTHRSLRAMGGGRVSPGGKAPPAQMERKLSIFDPRFNLREIAKQLALLEDHLFHKNKHCVDCISKHYITVEGLAEEAITLDKTQEHIAEALEVLKLKEVVPAFIQKIKDKQATEEEYRDMAQYLRQFRKPLAVKYASLV
jgi:hypothetical protein